MMIKLNRMFLWRKIWRKLVFLFLKIVVVETTSGYLVNESRGASKCECKIDACKRNDAENDFLKYVVHRYYVTKFVHFRIVLLSLNCMGNYARRGTCSISHTSSDR